MKDHTNIRELTLTTLLDIEKGNYKLDSIFENNKLNIKDLHLLKELIWGVCRYKLTLDWYIKQVSDYKIEKMPVKLINILRIGFYQILFLDKIPDYAAVNESVNLMKKYGHCGHVKLVNGILRNLIRKKDSLVKPETISSPADYLVFNFSLPQWLIDRWLSRYGFEFTKALASAIKNPHPLTLRVNTLQISTDELKTKLIDTGLDVYNGIFPETLIMEKGFSQGLKDIYGYNEGYWYVQDIGSVFVSKILDPKPYETILDICAAPGGKTTHIAQLMENKGEIISIDNSKTRMNKLLENSVRLKIDIIQPIVADAQINIPDCHIANKILVDVPCSSLGTIRHNPDILWAKTYDDFLMLQKKQLNILSNAAQFLKKNGILVYSTCTTEPEENKDVVKKFLKRNKDFKLVSLQEFLPTNWQEQNKGMIQLYPHIHNTDGFFIARMVKI